MFLRNYWYVAASAPEIGRKPFRRIIMNEPVVFYRTEDGTPVALEDRCPHRRLPLSMGRLVGDDWGGVDESSIACPDSLGCNADITQRSGNARHGLRRTKHEAFVRVPRIDE